MATSDWLNKHYDQRKTDKISHFEMNDSYLKKPSDKIIVRNLSVTSNSGRDAWKRQREQPAFVSITVHLAKPFQSASAEDVVDGSTVHYGKLSKSLTSRIKELNQNWLPTVELATSLNEAVTSLADSGVVKATEIDIFYPKATLLGDGAGVKSCFYHPDSSRMVSSILYYINHVTIPCVIGVNDHERQQKQPVVVTVSMDGFDPDESSISVQSSLTEAIDGSSFKTLESLATVTANVIMEKLIKETAQVDIELRVEKPVAVPSAAAAAIQVYQAWNTFRNK